MFHLFGREWKRDGLSRKAEGFSTRLCEVSVPSVTSKRACFENCVLQFKIICKKGAANDATMILITGECTGNDPSWDHTMTDKDEH